MIPTSIVLLLIGSAAQAQENRDLRVRVGGGAQVRPKYPGADAREVSPIIAVGIARGDTPFKFSASDDSFSLALVSSRGFALGPTANIASGRKDSEVGAPLGRVKSTVEVGGFAEYNLASSLRLRGELRKGLGGHEGLIGNVGVDAIWRDGDRYVVSVGPRLLWSDKRYQRAFFGVTPAAALASGLPVDRPGSGFHAAALQGGASFELNDRIGLFGRARYERLIGDAGRSPVVRDLGSRNQWSAGLGLSYTFRIKRPPSAD